MWECTLTALFDGTLYRTFMAVSDSIVDARNKALNDVAEWLVDTDSFDTFEIVKEQYV